MEKSEYDKWIHAAFTGASFTCLCTNHESFAIKKLLKRTHALTSLA